MKYFLLLLYIVFAIPMPESLSMVKRKFNHPSVVMIEGPNFSCTGFIVGKNVVATAAHCTPDGQKLRVKLVGKRPAEARVLWKSKLTDSALLATNTCGYPELALTNNRPKLGDPLIHYRYDMLTGEQLATTGIYVGYICTLDNKCEHYVASNIIPGDSGGPFINQEGEVVGVTSASYWPINGPLAMLASVYEIKEKLRTYRKDIWPAAPGCVTDYNW